MILAAISVEGSLVLDVESASRKRGAHAILFAGNGQQNQTFTWNADAAGRVIPMHCPHLCLDVKGGKIKQKSSLIFWSHAHPDNQLFQLGDSGYLTLTKAGGELCVGTPGPLGASGKPTRLCLVSRGDPRAVRWEWRPATYPNPLNESATDVMEAVKTRDGVEEHKNISAQEPNDLSGGSTTKNGTQSTKKKGKQKTGSSSKSELSVKEARAAGPASEVAVVVDEELAVSPEPPQPPETGSAEDDGDALARNEKAAWRRISMKMGFSGDAASDEDDDIETLYADAGEDGSDGAEMYAGAGAGGGGGGDDDEIYAGAGAGGSPGESSPVRSQGNRKSRNSLTSELSPTSEWRKAWSYAGRTAAEDDLASLLRDFSLSGELYFPLFDAGGGGSAAHVAQAGERTVSELLATLAPADDLLNHLFKCFLPLLLCASTY